MSSVTNPVLSNLLTTLGSTSPALASALSTSAVQTALKNASPGDLIKLSDQALQMQELDAIFGSSDSSQTTPPDLFSELSSITSGSDPTSSLTSSAASLQAQNLAALFQTTPATDSTNSMLDVLG